MTGCKSVMRDCILVIGNNHLVVIYSSYNQVYMVYTRDLAFIKCYTNVSRSLFAKIYLGPTPGFQYVREFSSSQGHRNGNSRLYQ